MPQCFVTNCSNYYGKTRGKVKVMYHIFPTKPELAAKWSVLCGYKKDFKAPPYARVCSEHFTASCYQRDLQHELLGLPLRKKLKHDAIPNKKLPNHTSINERNLKTGQMNKKKNDNVIRSSLGIISGNKSKQTVLSKGKMVGKKPKTHLENLANGNNTKSKPKTKQTVNKSNSIIRISIDNLCRNSSPSQRHSNPLKETTINKIERRLTKEVTIEPIKRISKEVTIEPVRKLNKQVTIERIFPKDQKESTNLESVGKNYHHIKHSSEMVILDAHKTDTKFDRNKTFEIEKKPKKLLWVNKSRRERMPMRSSIRIAKKKSIESLSESFTMKVNSKKGDQDCSKPERFSDKLKFMAMLQLRYLRNKNELGRFFGEAPHIIPLGPERR